MKNWAIVGLGFISPRHRAGIEHIGDKVLLTCDTDETKNADCKSFEEMLGNPIFANVQNVALCVPNDLHIPMAKKCLEMGKRVLCEKPIGISSKELKGLPKDGTLGSVLQLRYHPEVKKLKKSLKGKHEVEMKIVVKRDKSYWDGWKGQTKRSGGILFNLGVHYFDLLIHLFGNKYEVLSSLTSDSFKERWVQGWIRFPKADVKFELEIRSSDDGQERSLTIDDVPVSLSKQDNLSSEDLHKFVYRDFKKGIAITPNEAMKSIKLIEQINARIG